MGRELRCAASVAAVLLLMTAMVARASDPRVEWRMELIELVAVRTVYNLFCRVCIAWQSAVTTMDIHLSQFMDR
ncbi:hypothetical protein HaLaN_07559, partial [Haematococcus lacustris]